jgi:enoyl-CoA hydratase/carnithine racemase
MTALHTETDDGIVKVTITVPPLQLLTADLIRDLDRLLDRVDSEPDVRVVVFRSSDPDFFLMHADVEPLVAARADPDDPPSKPNYAVAVFERLRRMPCATIGVLDGIARGGGCELLCAMDLRIGSTRAVVGQPEVALGILPGAGGTVHWARAVGRARALELILTGRDLDAEEAFALGWLQAVVPPERLDDEVDQLARRIARMPAASIAAVKAVVDTALGSLDDAFLAESRALAQLLASEAHVEPVQRFLAAGGQTRAGETGDFERLLDDTLSSRDQ